MGLILSSPAEAAHGHLHVSLLFRPSLQNGPQLPAPEPLSLSPLRTALFPHPTTLKSSGDADCLRPRGRTLPPGTYHSAFPGKEDTPRPLGFLQLLTPPN